ncbi:MAG: ABC transporter permease [Desulfovibrio sp.]|nr:ABC transporter permease [Desulfovibrio sp.]
MRDFLFGVCILVRKETLMILKDKRSRIILIMPIIVQTVLFGYVATYDLNRVEYALLDEDRSHASRELARAFDGAGIYRRVATLRNSSETAGALDAKKALMVLHIGSGFERILNAGGTAPVQVVIDGRNSNVAGTASGYASTIVGEFNARRLQERGAAAPAATIAARAWFNPNLETRWGILSALTAVLSVIQVLSIAGQSVAREKEQGTFDQLLVTPFGPAAILLGKAIPPVLVGLAQSSIVLLAALAVFRIPFAGSYLLLYLALVIFNFAVVGVGLCVSAWSRNMQQAMLYNFTLLMPMILLSGFATPVSSMPETFQLATLCNPVRYGVELTQRIYLEGAGLEQVLPLLWPLALMSLVTLGAAARLFRTKLN